MAPSDRQPSIVGVAQYTQREDDPRAALEPVAMMERVLREAARDAGAPKLLKAVDAILVTQGMWKYRDAGALVRDRIGVPSATTGVAPVSGASVQTLIDWAAAEIASGRRDIVAIATAECERTQRQARKLGVALEWTEQPASHPDPPLRFDGDGMGYTMKRFEMERGINIASQGFALCDNYWRGVRGETPAAHRERIARLWARMSAIAAQNPHAWIQREVPADEIRRETPANRMISYPYTKLMTANIAVDQAAAILLCSRETARLYGVDEDRHVYLRGAAETTHLLTLSERMELHRHPGMDLSSARSLELAEVEAGDLDFVDLYSCFPFAVQAGAAALGLAEEQAPSVTGGLTFSGGPLNSYVAHATTALVEKLRARPGSFGMATSIGGMFAKFACAVYSAEPPKEVEPRVVDVGREVAATATHPYLEHYEGVATVEATTLNVGREGPVLATAACLTEAGERLWATCDDPEVMDSILADEDLGGARVRIDSDARFNLA